MDIRYAIIDCPLGRLLVAAAEHRVCAVGFGNSDAELESKLVREYPSAEIHRDETSMGQWVTALSEHLEGQQRHLDLPLYVQGTVFQQRVWQELRKIPYGQTRSYSDIARAIGHPKAARAVARACAANRIAVVIPCHRVICEDGSLGGYGGGVERKRALLSQEGALKESDE